MLNAESLGRAIAASADSLTLIDIPKFEAFLGKELSELDWKEKLALYYSNAIVKTLSTLAFGVSDSAFINEAASVIANKLPGNWGEILSPPGVYQFTINPSSCSWSINKIQSIQNYGYESYELQYFGNELINLKCSGLSPLTLPPSEVLSLISEAFGPEKVKWFMSVVPQHLISPGFWKVRELEEFYKGTTQELMLIWGMKVYFGFMTNFSYSWNADRPYNLTIEVAFKLHPKKIWNLWDSSQSFPFHQREMEMNLTSATLSDLYI